MRRAVVIGSNGPSDLSPLKYAAFDAQNVGEALSSPRCGFQILSPDPGADAFAIKRLIIDVIETCQPQDTFLLYFSGHGLLDKGNLFLLLDDTKVDRLLGSSLPVTETMQALAYCKAENKILVLDCCHAGAAISGYGFKDASRLPVEEAVKPENFLVLMASQRLERARELDDLQGSFLAFNIQSALTDRFYEAVPDDSNRLSIQHLKKWLEIQARAFNADHPNQQVPVPYLFGQQKGDFFLTVDETDWITHEVPWDDGSSLIVLPIRPSEGLAYCLAKFPVTNSQYKEVMGWEPVGENYVIDPKTKAGSWKGPFHPWNDPAFSSPNQPVVCVEVDSAREYAKRVDRMSRGSAFEQRTFLPATSIWDYAAFGTDSPPRKPSVWMERTKQVHHLASGPSAMDVDGTRTNSLGLADMIGNVWEWCEPTENRFEHEPSIAIKPRVRPEVRGGSFLDNLSKTPVSLTIQSLPNRENTRHSDLGFRIAGCIKIEALPEPVQIRLALARRLDSGPSLHTPLTA